MKITKLALSVLVGIGTGCTNVPPAPLVSMSDLPNCFASNYDKERGLFTIRKDVGNVVNQQCLLTVGPRAGAAPALTPGSYRVYLANGGGGGAGGTMQPFHRGGGGGGGGGGASAAETQATLNLTDGVYKLTIGAGGPGGNACVMSRTNAGEREGFGGGPGWLGSPSSMVRVATGALVVGTPAADRYIRPTRSQNERMAGEMDGHGGSGPGQASGGHGGHPATEGSVEVEAQPGASMLLAVGSMAGGAPGSVSLGDKRAGVGGGGGATSIEHGGGGGG